jgi:ABC-type hemin transport system substrate-binding protein
MRFLPTTRPAGRVFVSALLLLAACGAPRSAPRHALRAVTLAPNITEMIYALGAGATIAGTDNFSDYPPAAKSLPKVGGTQPSVEKIITLRPDVVFASTSSAPPGLEPSMRSARIPLVWVKTDRLPDVPAAMEQIGARLGVRGRARIVTELRNAIDAQRRTRAHPPRVLFVVWTNPLYIAGRETFVGDVLELCGATNAAAVTGWPQYSLESLVAHPPDLILYPNVSVTPAAMQELLATAHLHTRAIAVEENVFVRPGPRVAEAARRLNAILDATTGEDARRSTSSVERQASSPVEGSP